MGVRCTLLGHAYGEAEIERERDERGDEAVVTIREVKICERCGNRSVVSENKEVTAAGSAGVDVAGPDDADAAPTSEPRPTEPDSGDPVAAETIDDEDATAEGAEGPEHDAETDDGVILEDDEPEPPEEREYGEWPDADEDHASAEADPAAADDGEPEPWPDSDEDADEGYDAAPPENEPAPNVEYPGSAESDSTDPGEPGDRQESGDPDEPVDEGEIIDDATHSERGSGGGSANRPTDDGADFERAHEAGSPSRPTTGETELYCPACGYRDPSRDGSLREGDICPECRKGYLAAGE